MTDEFIPAFIPLTTTSETDIYVSSANNDLIVGIRTVNKTSSPATIEFWVTDGSDTHKVCFVPEKSVPAKDGFDDNFKLPLPSGYKIRAIAGTANAIDVIATVML